MARISAGSAERLAHEIAGPGPGAALAPELAGWLAGSSRFAAFVETHRSKIRKKLRTAADAASVQDVRAELAFARLVLADRRFEIAFEAYGRRGGPDFTLVYRSGPSFNVEITRLRRPPDPEAVANVVLGKLRQLPPGIPNLLVIAVEAEAADDLEVGAAIRRLRARADRKDDAFFAFRGIDGTRLFWDRFLRLGGVVAWCESASGDLRATAWLNGSARIALTAATMGPLLGRLRA
jgi:hypothetical protein